VSSGDFATPGVLLPCDAFPFVSSLTTKERELAHNLM